MVWRRIGTVTVGAAVLLASVGAQPADVGYPAPDPLPAVTAASLDERYAATERQVRQALAVARQAGDQARAGTLEPLQGRRLLEFDPRGNGRIVEVIGDLAGADRIAVLVPGAHTTLDTFDRSRGPGGGARALAAEIDVVVADADADADVAIVAWLGYDTPQGLGPAGITDRLAQDGTVALRATVEDLRAVNPDAPIALLCHSYGSVVCAHAVGGLPIADVAFYGSPGVGVASADQLDTGALVWAARAAEDWIKFIPNVRLVGIGFGTDPISPGFGARVFPAGGGGHGDYHLPGSESLRSLAMIALGGSWGSGSGRSSRSAAPDRAMVVG
jgi:hypothetical protein